MTFLDNEGRELLFDGDFAMTKQSVSIFNGSIKGDVSITFQVDNNSVNREILNYKGPMMTNQVAFRKQFFNRIRNGNFLDSGYIVIQEEDGPYLKCFYMSGNSNWMQLLQGLITELDYSGVSSRNNYELQLTEANVYASRLSTDGTIFPMVDWIYNYNKGNNTWFPASIRDTKNDEFYSCFDFYPCFYIHTLVEEILLQNGLKLRGNLSEDKIYNSLIITPQSGNIVRENINITRASGGDQVTSSTAPVLYSMTESTDPENAFDVSRYTAIRNSRVILTVVATGTISVGTAGLIVVKRSNTSNVYANVINSGNSGIQSTVRAVVLMKKGDYLEVFHNRTSGTGTLTSNVSVSVDVPTNITFEDTITPNIFLPELTCLEIIKFIVNYLGCSIYFDDVSKTLIINIIEKIKLEDSLDWSEYFISMKSDYTTETATNNYLRLEKVDDSIIRRYNKNHKIKYGESSILTDNTLKEDNDVIKVPFGASGFDLAKNNVWLTNIPLVTLNDASEGFAYTSIVDNGAGVDASYITNVNTGILKWQAVRIVDTSKNDIGIYVVSSIVAGVGTDTIRFFGLTFTATSTGLVYRQDITKNDITPRILISKKDMPISQISQFTSYDSYFNSTFTKTTRDNTAYAWFCKSLTKFDIDFNPDNAAFGNPDFENFIDNSIQKIYFNKIGSMLGSPKITVLMRLPETEFKNYNFDRFVYIKSEKFTGYLFIPVLENYVDGKTPIQLIAYML